MFGPFIVIKRYLVGLSILAQLFFGPIAYGSSTWDETSSVPEISLTRYEMIAGFPSHKQNCRSHLVSELGKCAGCLGASAITAATISTAFVYPQSFQLTSSFDTAVIYFDLDPPPPR